MKPRLPSAPPVPEEDDLDWHREHCYWGFRSADFGAHLEFCVESDRRDAELMLRLARCLPRHDGRPAVHWLMSIDLSGWLD